MPRLVYREATPADIPGMAEVRARDWGTEPYWRQRIHEYLAGEMHPRDALPTRVAFVCADQEHATTPTRAHRLRSGQAIEARVGDPVILGLVAGHLTRRFDCTGELQWISVRPEQRTQGIASELLRCLARWMVAHDARRVCVNVEPSNRIAQGFYAHRGATYLTPHWLVWEDIGQLCESKPDAS